MSASLVARGLGAGHGARVLFSELDLVVAPGDVIGLIGVNGAGKSTLLHLLAGLSQPQDGSVALSPPSASVGYLAQEPERRTGETVRQFLSRRAGVSAAQEQMDAAAEALGTGVPGAPAAPGANDAYSAALDRWLDLGGADFAERAEAILAQVGLGGGGLSSGSGNGSRVPGDALMTSLSGGQAARAALAALLSSRFDVLLLDEPTNDLDLAGLDQLESFVAAQRAGIVVVSHDREFLARTVTAVLELDLAQQQVHYFEGGYDAFLAERELARQHAREAFEAYDDKRGALGERAQMQRNWMDKGTRNARRKAGKDPDKISRKFQQDASEKQAAKARQTERLIERLDVVEEPRKEWELRMSIAAAPRSGTVVASVHEAVVRRGNFTLGPITAQVDWADRIAITGGNGAGKSTLLAALLGRVELTSGRASLGAGVVIGEVDQARALFDAPGSLLDVLGRLLPELVTAELRTLLAKFGLRGDHVTRAAHTLSPGERTRAALALLQARGVNLLVLDEPTNHLDLAAILQLESALASYEGTLLLVTHDRRMLDAVHTTRQWHIENGRLSESPT